MDPMKEKPFLSKIRSKVLAALLLAGLAVGLSVTITHFSFNELLGKVEEIAAPNPKLQLLNQLFQEITTLDQKQRAQAIRNPWQSYASILNDTQPLLGIIDSLQDMNWYDFRQLDRLDTMRQVLLQRDRTFLQYLRLRANLVYNKEFSNRIDSLSHIIQQSGSDSSVVTTRNRRVSTTLFTDTIYTDDRPIISKLFSRKKPSPTPQLIPKSKVVEESNVRVDTLSVAQKEQAIQEVDRIMRSLNQEQQERSSRLVERELGFINASNALTSQLLKILHQVEEEELAMVRINNELASDMVNESINRMGVIMLIFFLGVAVLVFFILVDISKGAFYRDQLLKAKEEAEQLSLVKQRFLANMSHEIRTPLQSIIGYTEQLKIGNIATDEAVKAINSSSDHLLHIVNEVLDYSRIISGKFTFEEKPFSLQRVLEEVMGSIKNQASQKGLTLLQDIPALSHTQMVGDAFRLRQILYNLLGNAVKFTHHGFIKLTVEMEEVGNEIDCLFQVSDSGIGMHPQEMELIFNQFEQAHGGITRQYGGTGLGLSIVKALVDAQEGQLNVQSKPGEGSTFSVSLRFAKSFEIPAQKSPINAAPAPVSSLKSGKALVVDDDLFILKLCSNILTRAGVAHFTTHQPEKLIANPLDSELEIAFLDIRMPHINGVELMQALKKELPKLRCIALTAHALPEEQERLLQAGFEQVLLKPFKEWQLLEALHLQNQSSEAVSFNGHDPDLNTLRKMTYGDETLLQEIIYQFVEDTTHDLHQLEDGLKWRMKEKVREAAHRLAGRIGQLGAKSISEEFRQIEQAMENDQSIQSIKKQTLNLLDQSHALVQTLQEKVPIN
jgi:signal transduction histidine kinase/CheY-like chemotaxis protein/HPt (histidine-containing phosphotransfer) domain-containing protein